MAERIPIASYQLAATRAGSGTFKIDGGGEATAEWVGRIQCTGHGDRDGRRPWLIRLYFSRPDQPVVPNTRHESPGGWTRVSLFLDQSQYDWCVDLLRNEAPVSLIWDAAFLAWFTDLFDSWMTVDNGPSPTIDFVTEPGLIDWGFEAIVMSNQRFVIVAIRGTQAPWDNLGTDWIVDLMFEPKSASWANGAVVHKGFRDLAEVVYPTLVSVVQDHTAGGKPLWLTGHSLGGSMATILGARLQASGDAPVAGVTSFGSPAVGDASWRDFYESIGLHRRTWRWVNNNDFGPLILVTATHVGELNFIDADGAIDLDSDQSGNVFLQNATDHDIVAYQTIIGSQLDAALAAQVPV